MSMRFIMIVASLLVMIWGFFFVWKLSPKEGKQDFWLENVAENAFSNVRF